MTKTTILQLADFLRSFSHDCWERIAFSRQIAQTRVSETTLTENFLYDLYKFSKKHKHRFPFSVYESKKELTNGADIMVYIQTQKGFVYFPCQAKIMKSNGRYPTLDQSNFNGLQIDLLLQEARVKSGIPIYLFYNSLISAGKNELSNSGNIDCGVTYANAHFVNAHYHKRKSTNQTVSFADLNLDMLPLRNAAHCLLGNSLENFVIDYESKVHSVEYLPLSDIDYDIWSRIHFPNEERISGMNPSFKYVEYRVEDDLEMPRFNPRHMIVFYDDELMEKGLGQLG